MLDRVGSIDQVSTHVNAISISENTPIQSLGRVLDVLGLFDAERSELSLSEIAQLLEWPIPTAHRAVGALAGFRLPDVARPYLQALTVESGETASLAVLDGAEVLFLATSAGTFRLRVDVTSGQRTPAHCSAIGHCLLAQLEPGDARRRLGPEPYVPGTERSAHTWAELAPRLERVRVDGFAISNGEPLWIISV